MYALWSIAVLVYVKPLKESSIIRCPAFIYFLCYSNINNTIRIWTTCIPCCCGFMNLSSKLSLWFFWISSKLSLWIFWMHAVFVKESLTFYVVRFVWLLVILISLQLLCALEYLYLDRMCIFPHNSCMFILFTKSVCECIL